MTPPAPLRHRSLADWHQEGSCFLDPAQFVSPPTSLSLVDPDICDTMLALPSADNVPYGRATFSVRPVANCTLDFVFRWQGPLAWVPQRHCYYFEFDDTLGIRLILLDGTGLHVLATWAHFWALNAWSRYRCSFTPACSPIALPSLTAQVEIFIAGVWSNLGIKPGLTNSWADLPINRLGFRVWSPQHWLDDVIIEALT